MTWLQKINPKYWGTLTGSRRQVLQGWAEGPLSHYEEAGSTQKEAEYFMQWIHPIKRHRIALRTPHGHRCTHGLADDVVNDDIGIKIDNQPEITREINKLLRVYLKNRGYIKELRKRVGNAEEQGEDIAIYYYDEPTDTGFKYLEHPPPDGAEILGMEAINKLDYNILFWDDNSNPKLFSVKIKAAHQRGTQSVRVHPSRIHRFVDKELFDRKTGWAILNVVYDPIVVLTNILKATGEAAFRWGTGHPLILTKNIMEDDEIAMIKSAIGVPTRRSWHILPSEFIEKFELVSQAGHMLNLKALEDIAINQVIVGTKIPKSVWMGEAQIAQGEVEDRSFYGLLYEKHVKYEPMLMDLFERDLNIQRIIYQVADGIPLYDIDWGIRETLSKLDEEEFEQRKSSRALACTAILTVNECREIMDFAPIEDERGNIILGVDPMFMAAEASAADEANNETEKNKSVDKMTNNPKDLEKDKTIYGKNKLRENKAKVRDAFEELRDDMSVEELCSLIGISRHTYYKLEKWSKK